MKIIQTVSGVVAAAIAMASVPAAAQGTAPAPQAPTTAAPAPQVPAPTAPVATAPAPADQTAQVEQIVTTDLPTYDQDKSGDLTEAELAPWLIALRTRAEAGTPGAPKLDAVAKAKWTREAFASIDGDKDKRVTKSEMVKFFSGAA